MLSQPAARRLGAGLIAALTILSVVAARAEKEQPTDLAAQREKLTKTYRDGNYKIAYDGIRKLALDGNNDPKQVGKDLDLGIACLQNLGRVDEIDEFREAVVAKHPNNWRLLETAATSFNRTERYGYIVGGKFSRGYKRGGGRYVSTWQRDRVRAMQLMSQALPLAEKDEDKPAAANFHLHFANLLLHGVGYHQAWRLQSLTDLTKLPDYEEGYYRGGRGGSDGRGAPVDEQNKPVYYGVPKGWEKAGNDGERWRWLLMQAVELNKGLVNETDMIQARFYKSQYGVQTIHTWGWRAPTADNGDRKTGTFALHTLKDTETIGRLATGLQRFSVPDEYNWIRIYERVAGRGKTNFGEEARDSLAHEYADRRQYVKAAAAWKKAIDDYGKGHADTRQKALDQIVGNWGRFEGNQTQPDNAKATVEYRFRNGKKVSFEAHAVKVDKLLADVQDYLKKRGANTQVDWQKTRIDDVGYRLVYENQSQYIGEKVHSWSQTLEPRDAHVDARVTVTTPMTKPGAYLLTAKMEGGNTSRVIVWLADTAIVKKQLDNKAFYFVADASTGKPIEGAKMEFFGWRTQYINNNQWRVDTTEFKKATDGDGQLTLGPNELSQNYNWMIIARKPKDTRDGSDRFAYLGFTGVWYGRMYDPEYSQVKTLVITDRPVYRPDHKVKFKAWVRRAQYDQGDVSDFAGRSFNVTIRNPKGDKVYEKTLKADAYAGLDDEYALPKDATLGVYSFQIDQLRGRHHGSGTFRVEEYKKPEFEVKIDSPKEPVMLGEKIEAKIDARYYFGAPVTQGKVKYKVTRVSHSNTWYPVGRWDWFYGTGYWWFAADYTWFPGFMEWGCCKPRFPWWGVPHEAPEVVVENEVDVGPDGSIKVVIDTAPARELHGDQDHKYTITAEVTDQSRRTIVGTGDVLVARKPFSVFSWVDRGHYRAGDTVKASFRALTLDRKPVEGKGELKLYQITYKDAKPVETTVGTWKIDTNAEGLASHQMKAAKAGQYRLSYKLTDAKDHTIEGGYLFVVRGTGFTGEDFRFNDIELVTDQREYAPGDKVNLLINTNQQDGTVLLFVRPTNGVYLAPKLIRMKGKTLAEEIAVAQKDMPNFFIEAVTVHGGKVHSDVREVIVPPQKRILNVEVLADKPEYKPGEKAKMKVRLTDMFGKPFEGSTVVSVYDRSVEYISGGSNVPEIRDYFWKWRRHHSPSHETNLTRSFYQLLKPTEIGMGDLGIFGAAVVEELEVTRARLSSTREGKGKDKKKADDAAPEAAAAPGFGGGPGGGALGPAPGKPGEMKDGKEAFREEGKPGQGGGEKPGVEPSVRKNFADTAYWTAALVTNKEGVAEINVPMPEQLTGWKVRVWAMGHGTKVGQGEVEVTTKKDLLVRMQAPRFFVQKDEVLLSANVHNYLKTAKPVTVKLEVEGGTLEILGDATVKVTVPAGGEKRVDWKVKVKDEGTATVRMKAITDEESDAMQMSFPCKVHGMLKMESYSGVIRPNKDTGKVTINVPKERRVPQTLLEVQYSPTLAGAMVDALPYMMEYPYGCTEQTLNRFLPTVITLRTLQRMNLDLADIQKKRTNLNAQELGDSKVRAAQWKRYNKNPVFDEQEALKMARAGVTALQNMQCGDGGWGWFSGWGEHSYPHTTAVVVHGLQLAKANDIAITPGVIERGIAWLQNHQADQVQRLKNAPQKVEFYKTHADETDALVYMVLRDNGISNDDMREFLYRDRTKLAVYAKAMFGLSLHKEKQTKKLDMILENISQFVVEDKENQTAYLKLPAGNRWWYWYGSEIEANAYYLKLLAATNPKDEKAAGLVKYLLNNRKNATYWNSTRDTAVCIEAMADYLKSSGEDKPDMTVEVWLDGKKHKEVKIDGKNLFSFDNRFVLVGSDLSDGKHEIELRKKGTGAVYFNAYLTNFTLEDHITKAGLEVKVDRKYYKLERVKDAKEKVRGSRGQPGDRAVEKYERKELKNLDTLKSGDLVEVELEIESKNDYEYLLFEDMKPAGFETLAVRSGYNGNDMGAYMEVRDDRVAFFVRALARGKHSVSYRMRAEIPGKFSALPAKAEAMYAPELKGNSDEIKLSVTD